MRRPEPGGAGTSPLSSTGIAVVSTDYRGRICGRNSVVDQGTANHRFNAEEFARPEIGIANRMGSRNRTLATGRAGGTKEAA